MDEDDRERIHEAARLAFHAIATKLSDLDSHRMALVLLIANEMHEQEMETEFSAHWVSRRKPRPSH